MYFLLPFGLSLVFSIILYLIGYVVAPRTTGTVGKLAPYACGEEYPARKIQVDVERFFLYLIFFTIFDISAFMLAISFSNPGFYPVIFVAVILLTVTTLLPVWRGT